jgi:hypothetical protein
MRPRHLTTTVLALLAVACAPEEPAHLEQLPSTDTRAIDDRSPPIPLPPGATLSVNQHRKLVAPPAAEGRVGAATTYTAGPLTVKIWSCINWPAASHPVVQCSVDPDYVLVGGGAWAAYSGAGALLTASYPVDPNTLRTWEGRSKDHGSPDPHILTVYAIGLKISGVSRNTLLGSAFVNRKTSAVANHPRTVASFFSESVLQTSDGCAVDWHGAGNMLKACVPDLGAAAKDHEWADPAAVTHYRIGLARNIPGFGELDLTTVDHSSSFGGGAREARPAHPSGFVPTGVSATDDNDLFGAGRLLTRMAPFTESTQFAAGASKDHLVPAQGSVRTILYALRKLP